MDNKRSQHFNYTFESLPTIFHSQTKNFFTYLEKDGMKFLEFWWDHMGVRLGQEESDPFENVSFEIKDIPEKKSRLVLLTMPAPKNLFECYFMAFLEEPLKRWNMSHLRSVLPEPALEKLQEVLDTFVMMMDLNPI